MTQIVGELDQEVEVRYARPSRRELEQLAELVVMNERMAGRDAARARNRVNHLKSKKANWEAIFDTLVETDAVATLDAIESANRRVEFALSDGARETMGVSDLKDDLERLQLELESAHSKLHATEAMLTRNLNRVKKIESEARELRNDCEERGDCTALDPALLTLSMDEEEDEDASPPRCTVYRNPPRGLAMFWYPAVLSSSLPEGGDNSVGFELLGTPWVVFRDATGAARCLKDECAHRACPLSLGPVIDGQIQCAYHGWTFDGRGSCQKMPSTRYMKGIKVRSLPCVEAEGVIQVWPCEDSVPSTLPEEEVMGTPEGLDTVLELSMMIPTDHQFLLENLMDLESDRGEKTWPRGFPLETVLNWMFPQGSPGTLSMTFEPSCTVVSSIGLGAGGGAGYGWAQALPDAHMPAKRQGPDAPALPTGAQLHPLAHWYPGGAGPVVEVCKGPPGGGPELSCRTGARRGRAAPVLRRAGWALPGMVLRARSHEGRGLLRGGHPTGLESEAVEMRSGGVHATVPLCPLVPAPRRYAADFSPRLNLDSCPTSA